VTLQVGDFYIFCSACGAGFHSNVLSCPDCGAPARRVGPGGRGHSIDATGRRAPVVYGIVRGDSPSPLQLAGGVLTVGGVLLAVRPSRPGEGSAERDGISLLLAVAAALGFGALFVGVSFAAKHSAPWAVCAVRAGGCSVIGAGALASKTPAARPRAQHAVAGDGGRTRRTGKQPLCARHDAWTRQPGRRRRLTVSGGHRDSRRASGRVRSSRRARARAGRSSRNASVARPAWNSSVYYLISGIARGASIPAAA
jgi:hypothetical protein